MNRRWLYLWLLSGIPVGLALIVMPPWLRWSAFGLFIFLDTGHAIAPIVAAWSHRGFRQTMDAARFVVYPILIMLVCAATGLMAQVGLTLCYKVLLEVYWAWNIYHFGMQHFGMARLCKIGANRQVQLIVALGLTTFAMAILPHLDHSLTGLLVMTGALSVNHWVTELGLTQRICGRWWFLPVTLGFGAVAFLWTKPAPYADLIHVTVPALLSLRYGLGIVHFLYDRWLYKFSDPSVRATIGKELLAHAG